MRDAKENREKNGRAIYGNARRPSENGTTRRLSAYSLKPFKTKIQRREMKNVRGKKVAERQCEKQSGKIGNKCTHLKAEESVAH